MFTRGSYGKVTFPLQQAESTRSHLHALRSPGEAGRKRHSQAQLPDPPPALHVESQEEVLHAPLHNLTSPPSSALPPHSVNMTHQASHNELTAQTACLCK